VPFPPAGGGDIVGRAVGERLSERLGQQVVIDNRGGASTVIGAELAARALCDGYMLMLVPNTTMVVLPSLRRDLPYDPVTKAFPTTRPSSFTATRTIGGPATRSGCSNCLVTPTRASWTAAG
jgi:tripartite-type tricarboxylate transporter receptor subunit TctC